MIKHIIEAYSRIDEMAKVTGIALIPRISRNDNLYTKKELARFDGITVPLNWEHNSDKKIGQVTFHYNPELEQVYYEGIITDERAANMARNKTLFTSIEADPKEMKEICNAPNDCFMMAYGLTPRALALVESPGIPETNLRVIEKYIKENCVQDCIQHKKDMGKDIDDQAIAICHSECDDKENMHNECPDGQKMKDGNCIDVENVKQMETELKFLKREIEKINEKITCKSCGKIKKFS